MRIMYAHITSVDSDAIIFNYKGELCQINLIFADKDVSSSNQVIFLRPITQQACKNVL